MKTPDFIDIGLFLLIIVGSFFAYLYGRNTRRFLWREYFVILIPPSLGFVGGVIRYGPKLLIVFIVSCILGPVLEWLLGFFYHKVLNAHLWVYERYPLPGRYSSYLTIPFWGFGLTFFWLLFRGF